MLAYVQSKNAKVLPIGLRVQLDNGEKMLQIFGILIISTVEVPRKDEDGSVSIIEQQNGRFMFLPGWFTDDFRAPTEEALKDVFQLQFVELYHHMDNESLIKERDSNRRKDILDALCKKEIASVS